MVLVCSDHPTDSGGAVLFARLPEHLAAGLVGFERIDGTNVPQPTTGLIGHVQDLEQYTGGPATRY
jgi:hypothetical protein